MLDDLDAPLTETALGHYRVATTAVPAVGADAVYRLWPAQDALLWAPPSGAHAVAVGAAARLTARGSGRMAQLREAAQRLWRSVEPPEDAGAPAPRLWGGFAFAPGAADHGPWQAFGDAGFVLPRLTCWIDGPRAWLQAVGARNDDSLDCDLAKAKAAIVRIAAAGGRDEAAPVDRRDAQRATIELADDTAWQRQVEHILRAIDAGQVRKVVAALRATVRFAQPPSVARVLDDLRDEAGSVWRFAFTRGGATFLGATPELLVRRCSDHVESEALAGTLAKTAGGGHDLMASAKDRSEHAFVRDGIVEALAPLCSELNVPDMPAVRELRRLFHLATPIRGRLARRVHVLELCERLHPTPAVCGTPNGRAMEIILSTEPVPRGWYSAPLGWFDASGDGEFVVGLRCGLLAGRNAYVHAGAGIVAGSRADRELAETRLKQRGLLLTLGLADA